ncbi:hypothetical protein [Rhodoplanes sp. SY1]|uniref:hypothetical protein n=1 Tax=Rhodoplanes sp. SY1 TaxID=3166646 RepID=UPI0038B42CF3
MAPTPAQTASGYRNLWDRAVVDPDRRDDAAAVAQRILRVKDRYGPVQAATGVPWPMIGALHVRESGLSFAGHLHNGDSLNGYTRQVPAGRPKVGHGPPFTWTESAVDALALKRLDKVTVFSLERILYECERYNGWGYLGKTNSPYLWSWTSLYTGGKYVRDHVYSATTKDRQPGCVAIFKALIDADPAVAVLFAAAPREAVPPAEVHAEATRRQRAIRNAGAAGTAAGGGGEAARQAGTVQPDTPVLHPVLIWSLVGIGVAVALAAGIAMVRRRRVITAAWTGARPPGATAVEVPVDPKSTT